MRGGVEKEPAHDLGKDVLGEARNAGVVEEDRTVGVFVVEKMMRQPANGRFLHEAGRGLDEFDAAENRAGLVLPAAAGGEHLLERQGAGEQGVAVDTLTCRTRMFETRNDFTWMIATCTPEL